jgi:lysophospholipase L1-like esterase
VAGFRHIWALVLLAGLFVLDANPATAEPRILWRVENPFRYFTDPADTEMHRATYMALRGTERQEPVLSAERALSQRHDGQGWAATMAGRVCWNNASNRHVCPGVRDYLHPTAHRLVFELTDVEDAAAVDCAWVMEPQSTRGRAARLTLPCDQPVVLDVPYPDGGQISVEVGAVRVATAVAQVTDLLVVGLGDSFAAGDGNPDVPVRFSRERVADYGLMGQDKKPIGYPTRVGSWRQIGDNAFIEQNPRWLDQACHRSLYSHQLRAAVQLAIEDPHRAVTFVSYACSGAEIINGLFLRYKGHEWVPNPPDLSQISAVAQAQCGRQEARDYDLPEAYHLGGRIPQLKGGLVLRRCDPEAARRIDLVLLSIGGNDIGFSRLLANAVLADQSVLRRLGGWFGEVYGFLDANAQLDRLEDLYKSLNRAIHNILHVPWNEADRIIVTAYPRLTLLGDGQSVCPDGHAGMSVVPDFALSEMKARDSGVAAARLDHVMEDASRQHGWTYANGHLSAFLGRGICAGWSDNALSTADDLRLPHKTGNGWEPYNPADWKAYASRQRWFRTPNDAFMTGNFHVSASLLQKALNLQTLSWFQLLLASLYSGAFHPTAEGQAAMADAVVLEARRVLAKHEGRRAVR